MHAHSPGWTGIQLQHRHRGQYSRRKVVALQQLMWLIVITLCLLSVYILRRATSDPRLVHGLPLLGTVLDLAKGSRFLRACRQQVMCTTIRSSRVRSFVSFLL